MSETYRPLPEGLTIRESSIEGLGLFATKHFKKDTVIGITHIENENFQHGLIRTPLGGFINHSEEPNTKTEGHASIYGNVLILKTIKDISPGDELLLKYSLYKL